MTLDNQAKDVRRALLKRPQTAGEIADRAGYTSGRSISRALGSVVREGGAVVVSTRPAKYAKA